MLSATYPNGFPIEPLILTMQGGLEENDEVSEDEINFPVHLYGNTYDEQEMIFEPEPHDAVGNYTYQLYYYWGGETAPEAYMLSTFTINFLVECCENCDCFQPEPEPPEERLILVGADSGMVNMCTLAKEMLDIESCGDVSASASTFTRATIEY